MDSEDLVSLVASAIARKEFPDLGLADPLAESVVERLELDAGMFDERTLRAAAVRTMVVDGIVRQFFERNPDGIAVSLHSALCTRFSRVDNGALRWIEIDKPDVAQLKSMLVCPPGTADDRHVLATCCCAGNASWMSLLEDARDVPTLVVAQRSLVRMTAKERDDFFVCASTRFPSGTELVLEHDSAHPIRPSSRTRHAPSVETLGEGGVWSRFPRIRFVPLDEYGDRLEYELAGLDCVARLFRGAGFPAVAHLRFR